MAMLNYGLAQPKMMTKADGDGLTDFNPYAPNLQTGVLGTSGGTSAPSSGGLGDIFRTVGNNATNLISNGLSNPALIPSLASATAAFNNAGEYRNQAEQYARQLD